MVREVTKRGRKLVMVVVFDGSSRTGQKGWWSAEQIITGLVIPTKRHGTSLARKSVRH